MNIIREYSIAQIRENHRTSASTMSAILIASTFLCVLFTFAQSYREYMIRQEVYSSGDWDAQLLEIYARQIPMIEDHVGVEQALIKGNNQTALCPDSIAMPYLLIQNCDAGYWNSMKEKNLILEGKMPQAPGEVVVGKNFFEQNPSYKIGDTLDLSLGERKNGDAVIDFLSPAQKGEVFVKSGDTNLIIVGVIDMTISSAYHGYPAYGWLEKTEVPEDAGIVVYLQMKQPSRVFETVSQIAQAVGLQKDEYGDFPYRYNTALLGMYGIYEPGRFWDSDLPKLLMALLFVTTASIAVFAYIIRGTFSISSKRKVKQLGILKSIGATPKQIWKTILYEACCLSVIPIVVSVGVGYLFSYAVLSAYSAMITDAGGSKMVVSFSPFVAILTMIISFLTVLLAASGPARQMAKLSPIQSIREGNNDSLLKKARKRLILGTGSGILGEISSNSILANKKLFRTCTVTLSLCILLMFGFLAVFAVSDINNDKAEQDNHFNVNITMEPGQRVEDSLIEEFKKLPHVTQMVTYTMANCAMWLNESDLSPEFLSSDGFAAKAAGEYVVQQDEQYRVPCALIGLDQETYRSFLTAAGVQDIDSSSAIVVNTVVKNPDARGHEAKKKMTTYLNLTNGQQLEVTEKFSNSIQGDYSFQLDVAGTLSAMPDIGRNIPYYTLPIIVPMETYYDIILNFNEDRDIYNYRTNVNLLADTGMDLRVQNDATQVCGAYLSNDDFFTSSKTEKAVVRKQLTAAIMLLVSSLAFLFGIVGISSATVAMINSLYQRRTEFALLRSVGVDEGGIRHLLRMESVLLAIRPILIVAPLFALICVYLLWEQGVTMAEFLLVFPVGKMVVYILLMIFVISGIYNLASRKIRGDIIIEALKDDTV